MPYIQKNSSKQYLSRNLNMSTCILLGIGTDPKKTDLDSTREIKNIVTLVTLKYP